jgi:hypothetical protein
MCLKHNIIPVLSIIPPDSRYAARAAILAAERRSAQAAISPEGGAFHVKIRAYFHP